LVEILQEEKFFSTEKTISSEEKTFFSREK